MSNKGWHVAFFRLLVSMQKCCLAAQIVQVHRQQQRRFYMGNDSCETLTLKRLIRGLPAVNVPHAHQPIRSLAMKPIEDKEGDIWETNELCWDEERALDIPMFWNGNPTRICAYDFPLQSSLCLQCCAAVDAQKSVFSSLQIYSHLLTFLKLYWTWGSGKYSDPGTWNSEQVRGTCSDMRGIRWVVFEAHSGKLRGIQGCKKG